VCISFSIILFLHTAVLLLVYDFLLKKKERNGQHTIVFFFSFALREYVRKRVFVHMCVVFTFVSFKITYTKSGFIQVCVLGLFMTPTFFVVLQKKKMCGGRLSVLILCHPICFLFNTYERNVNIIM